MGKTPEVITTPQVQEDIERAAMYDAQALFMRYVSISRIVSLTGVKLETLQQLIYCKGGWKEKREALHEEINEEIKQSTLIQLKRINGLSLDLIEAGLQGFKTKLSKRKNKAPSIEQTKLICDIQEKITKAKTFEESLDAGKKALGMGPAEVIKAFAKDPYFMEALNDNKKLGGPTDEQIEKRAMKELGENPNHPSNPN